MPRRCQLTCMESPRAADGPYPYQTAGGEPELWAQTLAAGEHLRSVFDQWVEESQTERAGPDVV